MMIRATLVFVLAIAMTVSGAFAKWQYTLDYTQEESFDIELSLSVFDYPPEEVLPDDEESSQMGENHLALIENSSPKRAMGLTPQKTHNT